VLAKASSRGLALSEKSVRPVQSAGESDRRYNLLGQFLTEFPPRPFAVPQSRCSDLWVATYFVAAFRMVAMSEGFIVFVLDYFVQ
jgi:hypothetical protein